MTKKIATSSWGYHLFESEGRNHDINGVSEKTFFYTRVLRKLLKNNDKWYIIFWSFFDILLGEMRFSFVTSNIKIWESRLERGILFYQEGYQKRPKKRIWFFAVSYVFTQYCRVQKTCFLLLLVTNEKRISPRRMSKKYQKMMYHLSLFFRGFRNTLV